MALFEEYRPRIHDSERRPLLTDLVIRVASLADVIPIAELEAVRDGEFLMLDVNEMWGGCSDFTQVTAAGPARTSDRPRRTTPRT